MDFGERCMHYFLLNCNLHVYEHLIWFLLLLNFLNIFLIDFEAKWDSCSILCHNLTPLFIIVYITCIKSHVISKSGIRCLYCSQRIQFLASLLHGDWPWSNCVFSMWLCATVRNQIIHFFSTIDKEMQGHLSSYLQVCVWDDGKIQKKTTQKNIQY